MISPDPDTGSKNHPATTTMTLLASLEAISREVERISAAVASACRDSRQEATLQPIRQRLQVVLCRLETAATHLHSTQR